MALEHPSTLPGVDVDAAAAPSWWSSLADAYNGASQVVSLQDRKRIQAACKRMLDLVVGTLILLACLPLIALIMLAIRIESAGPAFFTQERVGKNGRIFRMYKFRSMAADAEARKLSLLGQNEATGSLFKIRSDPRRTRVGRILRRLSLDELPQLINVIRGDMSLVGPRPPLPEEVSDYDVRARQRLLALPGLTGAWQVSDRRGHSFQEMVEQDLRYIGEWSFWKDICILLRTIPAVIIGHGAY
jgi:lipopolysaccharide/colanic/teichoic acid biosynthesis glycosyltransferase